MNKYCVNCKHFIPKEGDPHHLYAKCSGGVLPLPISLVTGLPKYGQENWYAEVQRNHNCGADAKFYEEKI
jgi:hypothetical protein